MLVLTESQVQSCPVLRKNIFEEVVLPGAAYQGKLFFRVARYTRSNASEARQAALKLAADHGGQFSVLIVQAKQQLILLQEDPELQPCSTRQAKVQRLQQMNLKTIAHRIHGPDGLAMGDRRWGLRLYKSCFVARDIATWLSQTYHLTDNDGVRLAQRMVDEKVIYHLRHRTVFKPNGDYYRFYDDEC